MGGSRNHWEAILPGKMRIFDNSYTVFVCFSLIGLFFSISGLKPVYFWHFNFYFIFYFKDDIFYIMIIVQCAAVINSINNPSVWGVVSLGGHFACLCRDLILMMKKKTYFFFKKRRERNTFMLLIIFIMRSLQEEQTNTNSLVWPIPICRNNRAITPKWINS